jgi:uncharacterized protein with NRDE domain
MCLILFSYLDHPRYRLILAANRDEFYERPARPLSFWPENPDIIAGRDEKGHGTWLGMNRNGKIAAVTNFRDLNALKKDGPSRGLLVLDYLENDDTPMGYLEKIREKAQAYSGFNLLMGDRDGLCYYSNLGGAAMEVLPGVHGLSNAFLDSPWPKVVRGKSALGKCISTPDQFSGEVFFDILKDVNRPADNDLPDTGIGLEWERILSPLFIESPTYGTRSSAVIVIDHAGNVTFAEKSWGPVNRGAVRFDFTIR